MELLDRLQSRFPEHYRHGNILMIHGDCMDVMAEIGEKKIPLACVDPPYGVKEAGGQTGGQGKLKNRVFNNGKIDKWDKAPDKEYFDNLFRISKNQIIWGGNYFTLPPARCMIVWDKVQPWENFSQVELAWTSFDGPAQLFKFDNRTGSKIHPTQKPVALYKWLLSRYAKPAELILDTHGGSGSIVIACHDLGHPIIWVEKDADYYHDSVKRFKTHASQQQLFTPSDVKQTDKQINLL